MDKKNCCGSVSKADKCQQNIKCEVSDCVYHATSNLCEAAQIEVCPCFGSSNEKANCKTYKQR